MAKNNNRLGITVRLNLEEQAEMRRLCVKYKTDQKGLLKMAFFLLIDSDDQMERKLKEAANASQGALSNPIGNADSDSGSALADEQPPSDTTAVAGVS